VIDEFLPTLVAEGFVWDLGVDPSGEPIYMAI
jgi:hypothetical protein